VKRIAIVSFQTTKVTMLVRYFRVILISYFSVRQGFKNYKKNMTHNFITVNFFLLYFEYTIKILKPYKRSAPIAPIFAEIIASCCYS
jgi:hypothetical protein